MRECKSPRRPRDRRPPGLKKPPMVYPPRPFAQKSLVVSLWAIKSLIESEHHIAFLQPSVCFPFLSEAGLGPPVERLEFGYHLFSAVYFSRGTLPAKEAARKGLAPRMGRLVDQRFAHEPKVPKTRPPQAPRLASLPIRSRPPGASQLPRGFARPPGAWPQ